MRLARTVGRGLFSAWVWASSFSWMLVGASITLVLLIIGLPYQRVHMWVTAPIFASVVRLAAIRVRLHYHPDFDPEERSIFCQNHINLLDGHLASAAIPHAFSGLMNAWQFKIPIYGWLMRLSKGIAVHRGRRDKVIEQISREAAKRKEVGMSVLTFPEGHRTTTGAVARFKRGVFMMARNARMSAVPIAVKGMYEANNKTTGWIFHPGKTVDVFVGPQFSTVGLSDNEVGELADRLHDWVESCIKTGEFPTPEQQPPRPAAESPAA